METVEKEQYELGSIWEISCSDEDESCGSCSDFNENNNEKSIKILEKEIKKSYLLNDPPPEEAQKEKFHRNSRKQFSYHSPTLRNLQGKVSSEQQCDDNSNRNPDKKQSKKSFKEKNALMISTNENYLENQANLTEKITSAHNNLKFFDIFHLLLEFDSMKNYKTYFPYNNSNIVVKNMKQTAGLMKNTRKIKRKIHSNLLSPNISKPNSAQDLIITKSQKL